MINLTNALDRSSWLTLWWTVEYVDRDGPVDLVLLVDDDGKQCALSTCQVNHAQGVQFIWKSLERELWIERIIQDEVDRRSYS